MTQAAAAPLVDPTQLLAGSSACPEPRAVWAELESLAAGPRLARRLATAPAGTPPVEILDLGASYRITAASGMREYRDENRDCAGRARVAAVFIALALDAPSASSAVAPPAAPPAAPPPQPAAPPQPAVTPAPPPAAGTPAPERILLPGDRWLRFEGGAVVHVGLGSGDRVVEPGLSLRLVFGRERWALVAGAVAALPVNTMVGGVGINQWRLPLVFGLRARSMRPTAAPYAELGAIAAYLSARGTNLATNERHGAMEFGFYGGAGVSLGRVAGVTPFVGGQVQYVPDPPAVFTLPRGVAGSTPAVWIGVAAGVSVDL